MTRRTLLVLGLAVAATLLNALKPPVIDDSAYLGYARQFHEHPSRPYDFEYYGRAANGYLVPPVFPAYLALGMSVVGGDLVALKLWLFPVLLLFVTSLSLLLRRFVPQLETPLLVLTVFSPAILPSINMMIDVPELAVALSALALYLHANDWESLVRALAAGLIAGLAMETKYTAFTLPAVFVLHGYLNRRWRLGLASAVVAVGTFAGIEATIALIHGDSHFILATNGRGQRPLLGALRLFVGMVSLSGGLASILWLIGLAALGYSRRLVLALLGLAVAGYVALALVPPPHDVLLVDPGSGHPLVIVNHVFVLPGIAFVITIGLVAQRLFRTSLPENDRISDFLVFWLLIELMCYLTISPFPAVRRLLGPMIAATILIGRLAILHGIDWERMRLIRGLTAAGVLLGLGYYLVELEDALEERSAFERAVAFVRRQDPHATIRAYGTWGFIELSERQGLIWTKNAGEDLQAGDWFIHDHRDGLPIHPSAMPYLERVQTFVEESRLPLTTQRTFYSGRTPMMRIVGPKIEITVYRFWPEGQ